MTEPLQATPASASPAPPAPSFHGANALNYRAPAEAAASSFGRGVEFEVVAVPPGGCVVHSQDCWHGSAPNVSSKRHRRALVVHFLRGDARFIEGHSLQVCIQLHTADERPPACAEAHMRFTPSHLQRRQSGRERAARGGVLRCSRPLEPCRRTRKAAGGCFRLLSGLLVDVLSIRRLHNRAAPTTQRTSVHVCSSQGTGGPSYIYSRYKRLELNDAEFSAVVA